MFTQATSFFLTRLWAIFAASFRFGAVINTMRILLRDLLIKRLTIQEILVFRQQPATP
jgi:hypothetical protein